MFISAQEYLQRISHALEHVVAPEVESDHLRGQVLAAVFLLDQLLDRIDYKPDLVRQEIEAACQTLRKVVQAFEHKACPAPGELESFIREFEKDGAGQDLAFRNRCNAMLSTAIDFFFAHRNKLDPAAAFELEGLLLDHCMQVAGRDLGMMKPSTSMKLLQKKGQPELK